MATGHWLRHVLAGVWCMASLPAISPVAHASFLPFFPSREAGQTHANTAEPDLDGVLSDMLHAVDVMQREYYAPWLGTWPTSIDWTGAVMGTHISAALRTLSEALAREDARDSGSYRGTKRDEPNWKLKANLVDNYFSQVTGYYFGENAVGIRGQAYDDILWVVLGWLEAVRFVDTHTKLHFSHVPSVSHMQGSGRALGGGGGLAEILANQTFFGNVWVPPFAHRSRVFWELSTHGWDDEYCGGGMTWNPRLLPYKNAITNELYIAASASMYLYFPGDNNSFPFLSGAASSKSAQEGQHRSDMHEADEVLLWPPHDPRYLKAAVDGYRWLATSNFTNEQGLIIDGFHISGYSDPNNNNTACDERNTQIFTYNQGVVLTGARGLWAATGSRAYLEDGHKLIRNVVNATGWDLRTDKVSATTTATDGDESDDEISDFRARGTLPTFHGLGRLGVLEELCDASATCNQDALTFKGIFFHHLAAFCEPLYYHDSDTATHDESAKRHEFVKTQSMHAEACLSYKAWLENNVRAALGTRDSQGRFGMWWTAGLLSPLSPSAPSFAPPGGWPTRSNDGVHHDASEEAVDYRNDGVPWDKTWRSAEDLAAHRAKQILLGDDGGPHGQGGPETTQAHSADDRVELKRRGSMVSGEGETPGSAGGSSVDDPNSRGAGRTVETQGGGVAVIRAYWSILAQA